MKSLKGPSNIKCQCITNYPKSLTPPENKQCQHTAHYYHAGKYFCKTHAAQWALAMVLETDTRQLEADIFRALHIQAPKSHSLTDLEGNTKISIGHDVINITRLVRDIGLKGTMR